VSDAVSSAIPMFQHLLMQFLDTKAPVLGNVLYPLTNCLYISLNSERNLLTLDDKTLLV